MNPTLNDLLDIKERIDRLPPALRQLLFGGSVNGATPTGKSRKPMSAATRKKLSQKKRAWWKAQRAKAKK